jgi:hypothetical protein
VVVLPLVVVWLLGDDNNATASFREMPSSGTKATKGRTSNVP